MVVFAVVVSVLGTVALGSAMTGGAAQASVSAGASLHVCTSGQVRGSCGGPRSRSRAAAIAVADHLVVTPAQAEQVVASYVSAARAANTVAAYNAVQGPPLSVLSDAQIGVAPPNNTMFTLTNVQVFVPRQTTYPAQFLALATEPGSTNPDFRVFTKRSVGAPWKAVYLTPAPSSTPTIFVDANDYARTVTGAAGLRVEPATLPHTLAAYFQQSLKANRSAPLRIFDSSLSGYVLNLIKADTANRETVTAAATTFPVYSYRTYNGGALSFCDLAFPSARRAGRNRDHRRPNRDLRTAGSGARIDASSALPLHRYRPPRPTGPDRPSREPTQRPDARRR